MRSTGETPWSFNVVVTHAGADTDTPLRERFDAQRILQAILFGVLGAVSGAVGGAAAGGEPVTAKDVWSGIVSGAAGGAAGGVAEAFGADAVRRALVGAFVAGFVDEALFGEMEFQPRPGAPQQRQDKADPPRSFRG